MRCYAVFVLSVLVASVCIGDSKSARILGLFNFNGRSHFVMFEALLKGLAARGHQVHVVGHFPQKNPVPNYTDISVEGSIPAVFNNFTVPGAVEFGKYDNVLRFVFQTSVDMCEILMEHPKLQELLHSNETYDLIITELFAVDCLIGFSHRFKAPFISMTSSVMLPWGNDRVGNSDHPAYTSNFFLPYTHHMTIGQRIINTVFTEILKLGHYMFAELPWDKLSKKYYGQDIPPLSELKKRTSLILVNSHFSLTNPRPTVPGVVEVGGLHIQNGGKLPEDLKNFLDKATEGVIYFSLGSVIMGGTLPEDKFEIFTAVFSQLPQSVVWKTDRNVSLPNVRTAWWLPQFEILSHPNVRVFITHGGLMGTQEAVHAGVPMIAIPFFADQELNINNCILRGFSVMLKYESITKESLSNALKMVLHDPSYQKNAKELSRRFRDRPQSPLETAIFWTEYVIRHRGASHLRSAAVDLTWYQYLLLDVMTVIVMFVLVMLATTYFILKKLIDIHRSNYCKKLKSS